MRVRHRIGCLDDPGQRRNVGRLFVDLVVHVADQLFVGVDDGRHAHRALRFNAPGRCIDTREAVRIHLPARLDVHDAGCRPQAFGVLSDPQCRVGRALRLTGGRVPRDIDGFAPQRGVSAVPSILTSKRPNSMLRTAIS